MTLFMMLWGYIKFIVKMSYAPLIWLVVVLGLMKEFVSNYITRRVLRTSQLVLCM